MSTATLQSRGRKEIHSGTELDKTGVLTLFYLLALYGVIDDSSGYSTCNLTIENFSKAGGIHHDRCSFIVCTGFWMPRNQVFSGMVFGVLDHPTGWVTRHVYIQWRHEDGNLQAFTFKVFGFFHFFHCDHFAVHRRENFVEARVDFAGRVTEELQDSKQSDQSYKLNGHPQPEEFNLEFGQKNDPDHTDEGYEDYALTFSMKHIRTNVAPKKQMARQTTNCRADPAVHRDRGEYPHCP